MISLNSKGLKIIEPESATDRKLKILTASIIALSCLNPRFVFAQSVSDRDSSQEAEINNENILEAWASYSDDASEIFSKVDLNTASTEDLLAIPGITTDFVSSIVKYRTRVKFIYSADELSMLDGASPEAISSLKKHTEIIPEEDFRLALSSYCSYSPQTISLYQNAYHDAGIRDFQKLQVDYQNAEFDAVTDKDAGENSYLDFYSVSLSLKRFSGLSAIDIGDYDLSLGNGILFSNAGTVSKSAGPISPLFVKHAYSLAPDRSRSENGYLRGAACEIPFGDLSFTSFFSSKDLGAHFDKSSQVTSIDYTGLNLNSSPPRSKLREKIAGEILRFDSPSAACGVTGIYFTYDHPFAGYYEQRQFVGESFVRMQTEKTAFSGELVADKAVSFSANTCLDYDEGKFAIGVRDLRSRIVPNFSGTLSENFPTEPEQGIYFGAKFHPQEIMNLGFYYDRFRIMSTTNDPERDGEEVFADSYVSLNRAGVFDGTATMVYLRYRYKTKEDFYVPETEYAAAQSVLAGSKQNLRIDLRHNFSSAFSIRSRFEKNFLSSGETGELFLFDAAWSSDHVSISSRICFYHTDSYNSAFYEVESDLEGVNQYTLFYGDGARLAALASTKISKSLSVGAKISRDLYNGKKELAVGSANGLFPGMTFLSFGLNYYIK